MTTRERTLDLVRGFATIRVTGDRPSISIDRSGSIQIEVEYRCGDDEWIEFEVCFRSRAETLLSIDAFRVTYDDLRFRGSPSRPIGDDRATATVVGLRVRDEVRDRDRATSPGRR